MSACSLRVLRFATCLVVLLGAASTSSSAKVDSHFRRIARGNIAWVAAGGHYAFFIKDRFARDRSGQLHLTGTTGTLIDERDSKRTNLIAPHCPDLATATFGGPWLLVQCDTSSDSPVLAVYDLAKRTWTPITLDETGPPPGGFCAGASDEGGGCSIAGVGLHWIEFEVTCYHCANRYVLQPIPSGPPKETSQVSPGGPTAFHLNSTSGVQTLCPPLTYPNPLYQRADGTTSHQPGWIEPLGTFALAADAYPVGGGSYSNAYLERCGSQSRIKLPGGNGIAATTNAIAWWTPSAINGIRLPSLRHFRIPTPTSVRGLPWPPIALSATNVYFLSNGNLWATSLRS